MKETPRRGLALAHSTFDGLLFGLTVDHRSREHLSAAVVERVEALNRRPSGLDDVPAHETVWRGPDWAGSDLSDAEIEVVLDAVVWLGRRLADRAVEEECPSSELIRVADHMMRLLHELASRGRIAIADARISPDPWEADLAQRIAEDVRLPPPSPGASAEGRLAALVAQLDGFFPDAVARDLWDAVERGETLPNGAHDVIAAALVRSHVGKSRLLVRAALVDALRAGVVWDPGPEASDDLAYAVPHADRLDLDVVAVLESLAPFRGQARESAVLAWLRRDAARLTTLLVMLDAESAPATLALVRRHARVSLDDDCHLLLAESLLEGELESRRRAAEVLRDEAQDGRSSAPSLKALVSAVSDPDDAVVRTATEALAALGRDFDFSHPNVAVRKGLVRHFDRNFDDVGAAALARLLLDPNDGVAWSAAHALEGVGRDAFWPGDGVVDALAGHPSAHANWWHFRLSLVFPEAVAHPLPPEMPKWATCSLCRLIPARSGGWGVPSEDQTRRLVPPIRWDVEGDGASRCPQCERAYAWSMHIDGRDLYRRPEYSLVRLTPERARQLGVGTPDDRTAGYRACLEHPEPWVVRDAKAAIAERS